MAYHKTNLKIFTTTHKRNKRCTLTPPVHKMTCTMKPLAHKACTMIYKTLILAHALPRHLPFLRHVLSRPRNRNRNKMLKSWRMRQKTCIRCVKIVYHYFYDVISCCFCSQEARDIDVPRTFASEPAPAGSGKVAVAVYDYQAGANQNYMTSKNKKNLKLC